MKQDNLESGLFHRNRVIQQERLTNPERYEITVEGERATELIRYHDENLATMNDIKHSQNLSLFNPLIIG